MRWLLVLGLLAACHGPGAPPNAAVVARESVLASVELGGLKAMELVTGGASPSAKLPLVVVLHCQGCSPNDWLPYLVAFPAEARFLLPYGKPVPDGFVWYDEEPGKPSPLGPVEAAAQVAAFIDAAVAARPTRGRAIVTGYSQGAVVAYTLAMTHPDRAAMVVPVSGALPAAATWAGGVPPVVHAFHGATDETIPVAKARASIARLKAAGFTADLAEYPVGHDTSKDEERDYLALLRAAVAAAP